MSNTCFQIVKLDNALLQLEIDLLILWDYTKCLRYLDYSEVGLYILNLHTL